MSVVAWSGPRLRLSSSVIWFCSTCHRLMLHQRVTGRSASTPKLTRPDNRLIAVDRHWTGMAGF